MDEPTFNGNGPGISGERQRKSKIRLKSYHELNLTWFDLWCRTKLLLMQKRTIQRGRPTGTTTYEAGPAIAFGMAVRAARTELGIAQETLAHLAGIERSHMGKIERGEHMPNLAIILRIARALNKSASELIAATEKNLQTEANANDG